MSATPITLEQVTAALPANLKKAASPEIVDLLNNIAADPMVAEQVRENFVSYTAILKDGKYKTEDFIHAIAYVSYKMMGDSNLEAYCKTFPQRHAALVARGASGKDISAYVAGYNKGQLVNKVLEQCIVPSWVLNQDLFQKALNVQADLMINANSEKVRSDAANSLLTHLKKPEAIKGQLDINVNDSSGMNELKEAMRKLAETQRDQIAGGVPIKQITDSVIIENEDSSNGAN